MPAMTKGRLVRSASHLVPAQAHVQPDPGRQVQRDVQKRQQSQRPPQPQKVQPHAPQGRDRQRRQQKLQPAQAQAAFDRLDRIGPEAAEDRPQTRIASGTRPSR